MQANWVGIAPTESAMIMAGPVKRPNAAEIDRRKFGEYSMNPDHPSNGGKAGGWRALGYHVDDPSARQTAATELRDLIGRHYCGTARSMKLVKPPTAATTKCLTDSSALMASTPHW
jgi:hypothetical protein